MAVYDWWERNFNHWKPMSPNVYVCMVQLKDGRQYRWESGNNKTTWSSPGHIKGSLKQKMTDQKWREDGRRYIHGLPGLDLFKSATIMDEAGNVIEVLDEAWLLGEE